METTYQKATQGVKRYLEMRGYEILEDGWCHGKDSIDFIALDENDDLVFVKCSIHGNDGDGIPEEQPDRKAFERIAAQTMRALHLVQLRNRFGKLLLGSVERA